MNSVTEFTRLVYAVRRQTPSVKDAVELGVVSTMMGSKREVFAAIDRLGDDKPLGYALAEFIEPSNYRDGKVKRAELKSLYADIPIQEDVAANQFYRGIGQHLVQSSVIESFQSGQSGYLTAKSKLSAAGFYRKLGWETNYLHATDNLLHRQPIKTPHQDLLTAEADSNRELDQMLAKNQRWPSITVNGVQKTHPMRIREGLGLPKNWRPAPEAMTAEEKIRHHARQLRAHVQKRRHFAEAPSGSKVGVMKLMRREGIRMDTVVD